MHQHLEGPGQSPLHLKGKILASLKLGEKATFQEVYTVFGLSTALLGHPASTVLGLIIRIEQ